MEDLQVKIAQRAYELFQARGGQHGYHMADWFQAEKEIKGAAAPARQPNKPAKTPSGPGRMATAAAGRKKTVAKNR